MIKIIREGLDDFDDFKDWNFNNKKISKMPKECIIGATLLSKEEAENLILQKNIECTYKGRPSQWWLRSEGYFNADARIIDYSGEIRHFCVDYNNIGVRPALILNIPSKTFEDNGIIVGDLFEFGGYEFEIISENLALCEKIISKCAFRKNYEAEDANVYEKSDVKKYVDNWFEKAYAEYKGSE